jgi:uncharacterized damage-inducible protein DinB
MPGLAPPVADEHHALHDFLGYHQQAFLAVSFGLTDAAARAKPTVSALSIGGLIKHVTAVQRAWIERVKAAPDFPAQDPRPKQQVMAEYADQHVMRDDETLEGLLAALTAQNAETLRVIDGADLDTFVPVPRDVPWFPTDVDHWSVRWVVHHLINELSRHAGHADIIRESIDGATMYELIAGLEGWSETDWIKPWKPRGVTNG